MIVAIDVHYRAEKAKVVGLLFENWQSKSPIDTYVIEMSKVAPYEPGSFYKRELPCILKILELIDLTAIKAIIVDGYVYLSDDFRPGLGYYLYQELSERIPIIGLAKRSFQNNIKNVVEILRGTSKNPLYITSVGIEVSTAAAHIQEMHGSFRMPTLLQILDTETKRL